MLFRSQKVIADMLPGSMLVLISLLTGESIGYGDGVLVMTLGLWLGGIFTLTVTVRDYDFGNLRSDLSFEEEV